MKRSTVGHGADEGPRQPRRAATQAALMDAALRLLRRDGVLSGLNLQEVADEAGVNRGLIHQYFGNRQTLLRSALDAYKRHMAPLVAGLTRLELPKRSALSFREYARDPSYPAMVMLLALDGDEEFEPMPFFADRLADIQREQEEGMLASDADPLALVVTLDVLVYGYFVMRSAIARQLGMSVRTLDRRVKAALDRMYGSFLAEGENLANR